MVQITKLPKYTIVQSLGAYAFTPEDKEICEELFRDLPHGEWTVRVNRALVYNVPSRKGKKS